MANARDGLPRLFECRLGVQTEPSALEMRPNNVHVTTVRRSGGAWPVTAGASDPLRLNELSRLLHRR